MLTKQVSSLDSPSAFCVSSSNMAWAAEVEGEIGEHVQRACHGGKQPQAARTSIMKTAAAQICSGHVERQAPIETLGKTLEPHRSGQLSQLLMLIALMLALLLLMKPRQRQRDFTGSCASEVQEGLKRKH